MSEITTVVLDAMGGDNAPAAMIDGAIDAISKEKNVKVILVGIEDVIRKGLEGKTYNPEQIEIVNATEVIETAEPPVHAIRRKKDSSIVVGMKLVKEGKADAFVPAGSSGAILVGGQVIVGRIKGVDRAPLAPLIPTEKGVSLLIDCGANVDARPAHLLQFAKMGFDLYGECSWYKGSEGRYREYRCGRREGQCTGQRYISTVKRTSGN